MKVAKISKKLIKPHTPTPPNLKSYYLSFIDQNVPSGNIAVVLFYQSKPENKRQLEESLAKILVQFYPLAGRYIKNDYLIDCSDQGAEFVEAEALDAELTTDLVVQNKEIHKQLNDLFPDQDFPSDAAIPLLSIQVTHFPSGGLAIAISVSHTVLDMWSLGTFITAWSNAANPDGKIAFSPSFDLPRLLPYKDHGSSSNTDDHLPSVDTRVFARFLFDEVALAKLRSKLIPNGNGKPVSRVRVVCAVMAKALILADRAKHGKTRDFVIAQPINMRERTITPHPKHACGNLIVSSFSRRMAAAEGEEIGMQELVDLIGGDVERSIADHAQILCPDRDGRDTIASAWENFLQHVSNPDINVIGFSDWSKFGLHEADFGWGKPLWVSIGPLVTVTDVVLMSNKGGDGIEAWVYLNPDHMHYFLQDEEINSFAA